MTMAIGLLGRKVGMTRIFTEDGATVPVSVVEIIPNRISQIKTQQIDGYAAIQLTGGKQRASRVNKPLAGHFVKSTVEPGDMLGEFHVSSTEQFLNGQVIAIHEVFSVGQLVDVSANSKGKGFAGTVKRHNFRTQDATHGNSLSHRVPGSIGQNQTPGRVFKGKKMAGHLGNIQCTIQNLELISVDQERNLLLIKGAIPGYPGARVEVRPAVKARRLKNGN